MFIYKNCILKIKKGEDVSMLEDLLRQHEFDLVGYKFIADVDLFLTTLPEEKIQNGVCEHGIFNKESSKKCHKGS